MDNFADKPLVLRAPEGDASRHSEGHQVRIDGRLWQVHQGQWVRVPEPAPSLFRSFAASCNGSAI